MKMILAMGILFNLLATNTLSQDQKKLSSEQVDFIRNKVNPFDAIVIESRRGEILSAYNDQSLITIKMSCFRDKCHFLKVSLDIWEGIIPYEYKVGDRRFLPTGNLEIKDIAKKDVKFWSFSQISAHGNMSSRRTKTEGKHLTFPSPETSETSYQGDFTLYVKPYMVKFRVGHSWPNPANRTWKPTSNEQQQLAERLIKKIKTCILQIKLGYSNHLNLNFSAGRSYINCM